MSRYTVELRRLVDVYGRETVKSWFNDWKFSDYLDDEQIKTIEDRGIWSTDRLLEMIIDEYYMREIGFETPDYFARRAKVAMRQIMEEKAPLIWTAAIKFDPLVNVDFTETYDSSFERGDSSTGSSTSATTSDGSGLTVNSDTPQGQISKSAILAGNYASQTQANESETSAHDQTNTNAKTSADGTEHYAKTTKGNSGVSATAQRMIEQTREIIVTIMRDICDDLQSLFLDLY